MNCPGDKERHKTLRGETIKLFCDYSNQWSFLSTLYKCTTQIHIFAVGAYTDMQKKLHLIPVYYIKQAAAEWLIKIYSGVPDKYQKIDLEKRRLEMWFGMTANLCSALHTNHPSKRRLAFTYSIAENMHCKKSLVTLAMRQNLIWIGHICLSKPSTTLLFLFNFFEMHEVGIYRGTWRTSKRISTW